MSSGVQFMSNPGEEASHLFSFTYDHYSERLKGGLAWLFFQGLEGKNNSRKNGAGLAFSRPVFNSENGRLIASANLNCFIYTKQLYGYAAERLVTGNDHHTEAGPFRKFNELLPAAGLLWNSYSFRTGISFWLPFRFFNGRKPVQENYSEYTSVIYFAKNYEGVAHGLLSKPYNAEPEAVILITGRHFMARTGIKLENAKNNFGLFLLNNFSGELHGLTGLTGWNIKNIKINIAGGCLYSLPFKTFSMNGELFIGLTLPAIQLNEGKPWAPSGKLF